jgi:periplasmic protein CpxP/Spy
MYKTLIGICALAFSFVLSQSSFADSSHCKHNLKNMVESLKLDDQQKAKIKPIMDQLKTTMQNNASQMGNLRTQINQQVTAPTMDQNAVNGLVDQKTKIIGDIMKAKITAKNQIYGILNDQQKAQLADQMKKMEEKMAAKYKECHEDE